jgi:uncharacterized membrane protein YeaQ/YmgE (transglycosylase-associated protein family)
MALNLQEGIAMGIIAWIIFGLIAGAIAKLIMPGRDGGGFILTCVLGVVGAVVGGWLATMFGFGGNISGFDLHSFLVAVVGAIVVLGVFRLLDEHKNSEKRLSSEGRFLW